MSQAVPDRAHAPAARSRTSRRTTSSSSTGASGPPHPSLVDLFTCMFLHGGLPPPRSATCCSSGSTATTSSTAWARLRYLLCVPRHRRSRRRSSTSLGASQSDDPAGRRLGRHLGHARLLLRLVPAQPRAPALAAAAVPHAGRSRCRRASCSASTSCSTTCCRTWSRSGDAGVAHGAHIGGFLAGLAAAWVMDRREIAARPAGVRRRARGLARRRSPTGRRASPPPSTPDAWRRPPSSTSRCRRTRAAACSRPSARWRWRAGCSSTGTHEAALVVARRHLRDYPERPGARGGARARRPGPARDRGSRRRPTSTSWPRSTPTPTPATAAAARRGHRGDRGPAEAADRPPARPPGLTSAAARGACARPRGGEMSETS